MGRLVYLPVREMVLPHRLGVDKADLVDDAQVLQEGLDPAAFAAFTDRLNGEVEDEPIFDERGAAATDLLIPLYHQHVQSLAGEETAAGEPSHPGSNDDRVRIVDHTCSRPSICPPNIAYYLPFR